MNISAAVATHPLNNEIIAFIIEKECNNAKVEETLTSKILAKQFDMVAYLTNGNYGVTIGEAERVKHGSIFPTAKVGSYVYYLESQVYPVLSGNSEQIDAMKKALALETVKERLQFSEPYIVDISIEIDGENYYKQFDFYVL